MTTALPSPSSPTGSAPRPQQPPRFERATDDLRQVVGGVVRSSSPLGFQLTKGVLRMQRRWVRQVGPLMDARQVLPPLAEPGTWQNHPDAPLHWMRVESVWKDLPTVTESELAAEAAASGGQPSISSS